MASSIHDNLRSNPDSCAQSKSLGTTAIISVMVVLRRFHGSILFGLFFYSQLGFGETRSPCHNKCRYIEAYKQANCENRFLDAVPLECSSASYLSLRHNHITSVEPGTFQTFPSLKYLILSNNQIAEVQANTFEGAPKLKSIKLLYNILTTFDVNALNGTSLDLRNLYLSRNTLGAIVPGTFQHAPGLEFIDLYNNSLTNVTSAIFSGLGQLNRLYLGMNKLAFLPEDLFSGSPSLAYLDLSNNSLSYLPAGLFRHSTRLRTIDLSGNRLMVVSETLFFPTVRDIDLRWNNITTIENLNNQSLTSLERIYLVNNPFRCNCNLEPLRQWYQELSALDRDVSTDSPTCSNGTIAIPINRSESLCKDVSTTPMTSAEQIVRHDTTTTTTRDGIGPGSNEDRHYTVQDELPALGTFPNIHEYRDESLDNSQFITLEIVLPILLAFIILLAILALSLRLYKAQIVDKEGDIVMHGKHLFGKESQDLMKNNSEEIQRTSKTKRGTRLNGPFTV